MNLLGKYMYQNKKQFKNKTTYIAQNSESIIKKSAILNEWMTLNQNIL